MGKIILYILVFIVRVLSLAALFPLILFSFLNYLDSDSRLIYFLTALIVDLSILIVCYPIWKEMDEKTTFDSDKRAELLLKSKKTPTNVRKAIHAFQTKVATLDDAITVAPYDIYYMETYDMLKQNFSFVRNEPKRFFIREEQDDFLQSLKEVRSGKLSSEEAIVALSYELLTPSDVVKVLRENKDDYPKILKELSPSHFRKDFSCRAIIKLLRKEQKNSKVR